MVSLVKNADRLRQIVTILARHGFGELLGRINLRALVPGAGSGPDSRTPLAVRVREAAQELGPSFVKLGQILSTRDDLLPADVVAELGKLRDSVPPMSGDEVDAALDQAFGDLRQQLFADISPQPLAAASIGQVHRARLRVGDGEVDVAVKIQRPRIHSLIERDMDLLYLLARLLERYVPESTVYSPVQLVAEFDRAMTAELDFTVEADNAEQFARNFEGDASVRFPRIYREASSKRVLTMEWFDGLGFEQAAEAEGAGPRIARVAVHIIARMIFEHGFFHADPHPGNIVMLGSPEEPVVGLIDLGQVGRLSPEIRDRMLDLMVAAATGDAGLIADGLLAMGRPRGRLDRVAFRAEVARLSERYLGRSLRDIDASGLVRDLIDGAVKFDIEMPPELMLMGKALVTIEAVGKRLDPELDLLAQLRPQLLRLLRRRYSPERLGRDLLRGLSRLRTSAGELPGQVNDILNDLRAGRLEVRTTDRTMARAEDRLGRRIFSGLVAAALLGSGTALAAVGRHDALGVAMLVAAALVVAAHLLRDWREAALARRERR